MEKLLLKVQEAAEITGVGRTLAYQLVASGEWPIVRLGKSVRVPVSGLKEWIERSTTGGAKNDIAVRDDEEEL